MRRWRFLLPILVLLGGFPCGAWAQNPSLVRDINPGSPWNAGPAMGGGLLAASGRLFFAGNDSEPAVADGAGTGSEVLADLCPGDCGSSPRFLGSVANGVALFAATPGEHSTGAGLYRTDGTRAGTYGLGRPIDRDNFYGSWVFAGGRFFFAQCADIESCALWTSDGTAAGTRAVKDLPGQPTRLTAVGGKVFFFLQTDLWVSDGTAAGTALVRSLDRLAFPSIPAGGTAHLYFTAGTGNGDTELWASDGTAAGTRTVTHFANPNPFFAPQQASILTIGDRAYVIADDVLHGAELWESDGSPAGTRRITDFGFAHPFESSGGDGVPDIARLGGRFVFLASDGLHGRQVWTSDGTPASTALLSPVQVDDNARLVPAGGRVVFLVDNPEGSPGGGRELWGTDGTAAGTRKLAPVFSGPCCPSFSYGATAIGSTAYFTRLDGTFHVALWATDGTPAGTRRFAAPEGARDLSLFDLAQIGRQLFFSASGATLGDGLWTSDGTPGGTHPVPGVPTSGAGSTPQELLPLGGQVVFTACDGLDRQVWASAGSAATTRPLSHLPESSFDRCFETGPRGLAVAGPGLFFWVGNELWHTDLGGNAVALGSFDFRDAPLLVPFGDEVFFTLFVFGSGTGQIWRSDGTPSGTRIASELAAIPAQPAAPAAAGGRLYFLGYDTTSSLWVSDGTAAGTRLLVTDLQVLLGRQPFVAGPLVVQAGPWAYFFVQPSPAGPGQPGTSLWRTDGTAAGTAFVSQISTANFSQAPPEPVPFGGALLFFASDGVSRGLYRSDGTAAGTFLLHPFHERGDDFSLPSASPVAFAGRMYFAADDGVHGRELWSTDGTVAGTVLVRDLFPGPDSSGIDQLTVAGGRLWFTAWDPVHGVELWQSDGNAGEGAGTRLAADVWPESPSSAPDPLAAVGDRLYFGADDGLAGRELWTLDAAVPGACQASDIRLCLNADRFQVEIAWQDFQGHTGVGHAVALTADTGYFWFFADSNVEVVVKVLDARSLNQAFWVFYGALSTVEYAITVTDTQTGLTRRYVNPAGHLASVGDTNGFGPLGSFDSKALVAPPSALPLVAARTDPRAATGSCVPSAQRLCLNGNRFAVTAAWKDFSGHTGTGTAVPLTADTGYFWFFSSTNVELMTKVLDGRGVNGKFWLFYGALSNVEYTLTVTDTQTGAVKTYKNPSGRFGSVADTGAF